jgi:Fur family ferric uptake transcriptional regulator
LYTIEFNNDSILKIGMKQAEKSGLHLLDCQLTIHTVCHEALRMGWPSLVSSNWCCPRAIAAICPSDCEENQANNET